ncbi:MAG: sugar phosphate isomerase/epimerase [Clostridia bacterium]|nr:sugar phosphate isomerase/epimerase [Clostridia bacterium]
MKTSTEINSAAKRIGEEKTIEMVARAGFDAWDFSMFRMCNITWGIHEAPLNPDHPLGGRDYLAFARHLRRVGEDCGIVCNQSHAPFPSYYAGIEVALKRAIECTAEAGAEICVIHPDNYKSAEENAEFFLNLLPFAKSCGVKIATENMWTWDKEKDESAFAACATGADFCRHVDAVNDPFLVACLDIGHAEMRGSGDGAPNMIRALGHRLAALHLHDNDQWKDSHNIPFSMSIDFDAVVRALHEIDYRGYFTLEADQYLKDYADEDIYNGILALSRAARRLADAYEAL